MFLNIYMNITDINRFLTFRMILIIFLLAGDGGVLCSATLETTVELTPGRHLATTSLAFLPLRSSGSGWRFRGFLLLGAFIIGRKATALTTYLKGPKQCATIWTEHLYLLTSVAFTFLEQWSHGHSVDGVWCFLQVLQEGSVIGSYLSFIG